MRALLLSLVLASSTSLLLSGCKLSQEERAERARRMWAEKSPPVADRIAALERAADAATTVQSKDVAEFALGDRPGLLVGSPRNTLIINVGDAPLPAKALAFRSGNTLNLAHERDYLERDLANTILEVKGLRYLAVVRPHIERQADFDDSTIKVDEEKRLNLTVRGGESTVEVLVFDVDDGTLLGRHEVRARNSSTVTGSYVNPADNMAADLREQVRKNVESWLTHGTKKK